MEYESARAVVCPWACDSMVHLDLERRCALVLPDAIRAAALAAMGERAP